MRLLAILSGRSLGEVIRAGVSKYSLLLGVVVVMATLPLWFGLVGGFLALGTTMLVWMLFAIGYDMELGYAGQLSIGHTIMFGVGGYAAGLALLHVAESLLLALTLGTIAAGIIAVIVGWVSHRTSGLYFALVTLAFSMMFYFSATQIGFVGGHDGLAGVPQPLPGSLFEFYFLLTIVAVSGLIAFRIVDSPYGMVLRGVRENEQRLEHLGYDINRYKISVFTISGLFAGLAGSMLVVTQGFIGPGVFFWVTAFEIIIYTIIGGMGTLTGPMIAAAVLVAFESIIGGHLDHWEPILGALFIIVIVFLPKGLYGLIESIRGDK